MAYIFTARLTKIYGGLRLWNSTAAYGEGEGVYGKTVTYSRIVTIGNLRLVANLLQYMSAKNYENRLIRGSYSEYKVGPFIETV